MLLKEANIYPLSGELKDNAFGYAQGLHTKRTTVLVELKDSSGEIGIGESGVGNHISIAYRAKDFLESIIGKEMSYNQIYNILYTKIKYQDEGFYGFSALSAIDIALNDLISKKLGITIADLYGGKVRSGVPVYAGTGYFHPEEAKELKFLSEQVEQALNLHMKAIKIKVGGNIERDLRRIKTAQEIIQGRVPLMIDANQSYSSLTAIKLAKIIKDEIMFFEEPVFYKDFDTMRKIQEIGLPVAAAESVSGLSDFIDYILKADVAILEPDITKVGGINGLFKISVVCNGFNRLMFPHNWSTQVSTSASVNVMLTVPSNAHSYPYGPEEPLLEIDLAPNPLREIFEEDYSMHNGVIIPGNKKGLGIEVKENYLKKYLITEKPITILP